MRRESSGFALLVAVANTQVGCGVGKLHLNVKGLARHVNGLAIDGGVAATQTIEVGLDAIDRQAAHQAKATPQREPVGKCAQAAGFECAGDIHALPVAILVGGQSTGVFTTQPQVVAHGVGIAQGVEARQP